MNYKMAILVGLWGAQLSLADMLPPFAGECAVLDRVLDSARPGTPEREVALKILELVAEGRMGSADPELETKVGLTAGELHDRYFASSTVRACALHNLGRADEPEALGYLANLREEDVGHDGRVWPAARIALHEARLRRIAQPWDRIAFLERSLSEWDEVDHWAAEQLCNGGHYPSLPLIAEAIRRHLSQDAEKEIGFCEARMEILSRNPDRVVAVGSFLKADGRPITRSLTGWAINQLDAMKSPKADAELERYAKELERAKDSLPDKEEAAYTASKVRDVLARRPAPSSRR